MELIFEDKQKRTINDTEEMNWKNRVLKSVVSFCCILIVLVFLIIRIEKRTEKGESPKTLGATNSEESQSEKIERILTYKENSPDGTKEILRYQFSSHPVIFSNYKNYLNNNIFIALKELKDNRESYLFIGEERTGDPHWLGNDYIFFTNYCGTSCKGIYLVNALDKTTKQAIISYFFEKNGPWQTHFKDWFGKDFVFPGLIKNIEAKYEMGKAILIFKRDDGQGADLEDKLFVFEENRLVP